MFGRKTGDHGGGELVEEAADLSESIQPAARRETRPGAGGEGKNRPTPTRREAQAARRQPLVPTDRKVAQQQNRAKERERRAKQRAAMLAGETWALPTRDQGPERAYIRDYIDARWTIGEFIMPVVLVGFALSIVPNRSTLLLGYGIVYLSFLAAILDITVLWFVLRRRIQGRFGRRPARGSLFYVLTRVLQIRPGRIPRPRVRRGQFPR